MKTAQQMITKALRQLGALGSGDDPDADQASDGLDSLIGLYNGLISDGVFGPIKDVLITAAYTAGENERVIDATGLLTITLPLTVTDYDAYPNWCDGLTPTTRAVQDRAVVLEPGATPKAWLFDSDLNAWTDLNALTLTSTVPLSGRFYTGLGALLAVALAAEYGLGVPQQVAAEAAAAIGALRRKRPVKVVAEFPVLRTLGRWHGRC